MKTFGSRAIAQRADNRQENFVRLWGSAMWILAAIYLAGHVILH